MKKTTVLMLVLGLLALCSASFAANFDVGGYPGTENPQMVTSGSATATWGVYQAADASLFSTYVLMTSAGIPLWVGTSIDNPVPSIDGYVRLTSRGAPRIAVLTFTPTNDAYCSFYGLIDHYGSTETVLHIAKIDKFGYTTDLKVFYWAWDTQAFLAGVPELTNVLVNKNEKLAIYGVPTNPDSWVTLEMFGKGGDTGISTQPAASVSGIVVSDQYSSDVARVGLSLVFSQNGAVVKSAQLFPASDGSFTLGGIAPGVYDITVSGDAFLAKVLLGKDCSAEMTDLGTITLLAGDIDGDNEVTSTDLSILGLNLGIMGESL